MERCKKGSHWLQRVDHDAWPFCCTRCGARGRLVVQMEPRPKKRESR